VGRRWKGVTKGESTKNAACRAGNTYRHSFPPLRKIVMILAMKSSAAAIGSAALCITQLAGVMARPVPVQLRLVESSSGEDGTPAHRHARKQRVGQHQPQVNDGHTPKQASPPKSLNPHAAPYVPSSSPRSTRPRGTQHFHPLSGHQEPFSFKANQDHMHDIHKFLSEQKAHYVAKNGLDPHLGKSEPAWVLPPRMKYSPLPSETSSEGVASGAEEEKQHQQLLSEQMKGQIEHQHHRDEKKLQQQHEGTPVYAPTQKVGRNGEHYIRSPRKLKGKSDRQVWRKVQRAQVTNESGSADLTDSSNKEEKPLRHVQTDPTPLSIHSPSAEHHKAASSDQSISSPTSISPTHHATLGTSESMDLGKGTSASVALKQAETASSSTTSTASKKKKSKKSKKSKKRASPIEESEAKKKEMEEFEKMLCEYRGKVSKRGVCEQIADCD
jgi:ribulose bisphosphate carboxylase small subunit